MRCRHFGESLDAYVLGELAPDERPRVEAHAGECVGCARMLAERRELLGMLQADAAPALPGGFADRVTAAAEARLASRLRAVPSRSRGGRWAGVFEPRRLAAVVAMAAGLLIGAWLGQQTWPAVEDRPGDGPSAARPASSLDYLVDFRDESLAQSYYLLTSTSENPENGGA